MVKLFKFIWWNFHLKQQTIIHLQKQEKMTGKIILTCRKCSLGLIFMLLLQSAVGQADFSGVDAILKKNEKILGKEYALLIYKGGKNILLRETEEFKMKNPAPIAHSSQWLTAALVMTLVDEGKLNLDEPVSKYIPIFNKYMKGYITLRHCLSHTTGLDNDPVGLLKIAQKTKFASLEEEVDHYVIKKLIVDNPGQAFAYGSVGHNIAARVIEVATKKSFERVIAEKLFRPLGIRSASFYNESGGAPNPSGWAMCSAFDYVNFMQMLLNKGMFNGKKVLSEKSVNDLMKQQFPDAKTRYEPEMTKGFGYGMGCWILEEDGKGNGIILSAVGMYGAWPWMDTKRNLAGILLLNQQNDNLKRDLPMQLMDAINAAVDGN
jgi:CubicO group peptidase (beta-lactamase class C family)